MRAEGILDHLLLNLRDLGFERPHGEFEVRHSDLQLFIFVSNDFPKSIQLMSKCFSTISDGLLGKLKLLKTNVVRLKVHLPFCHLLLYPCNVGILWVGSLISITCRRGRTLKCLPR